MDYTVLVYAPNLIGERRGPRRASGRKIVRRECGREEERFSLWFVCQVTECYSHGGHQLEYCTCTGFAVLHGCPDQLLCSRRRELVGERVWRRKKCSS